MRVPDINTGMTGGMNSDPRKSGMSDIDGSIPMPQVPVVDEEVPANPFVNEGDMY